MTVLNAYFYMLLTVKNKMLKGERYYHVSVRDITILKHVVVENILPRFLTVLNSIAVKSLQH